MTNSFSEDPTSLGQSHAEGGGGATLPVGATIGRYRILGLVGEGGMGAVYEAEQEQPRRTVALKVIKPGLGGTDLLRRFEREAQALGRLQHVGIAQIYEAGTADAGAGSQPYFAMEFIRGRSLRDYAREHELKARDRLALVAKVCEAVHHAHERGLIHRDLKPGNILVDETGQPKVLDFGVARVTDSDGQATLHTHVGEIVGTLAYMSPEQVLADPLKIDARSDVYALGVILYELLADRLPYEVSRRIHEAVVTIRDAEPVRLSAVQRAYRGDVETIVAKALEKDPARRYASAASMGEDIRRYLRDEPIVARPASAVYRLHKAARRHKALVGGAAAVGLVLIAGILASTWQARRARDAERSSTSASERAAAAESLGQPMPVDPAIQMGEFPNGLRYYVRANAKPARRAELRLVVKAGSVLEEDDQQGLAHFIEHMAFNGTTHFPKNEILSFIQSIGMRFGEGLNAYTSFDETVFQLRVPTDDAATIDRALLVLEDWAHGISFDASEIDKERGVVIEEWRMRQGAGSRMQDRKLPILFKGSLYADRIPIGKPDVLRAFPAERLKQFYRDWYRPDLMAVVAVGDFDQTAVVNLVKGHFAGIPAPARVRPRPSYDVDHPGTIYAIVTDKEATSTNVQLGSLLPARSPGLVAGYRLEILDRLFAGMLTARLAETAQQPDAPFIGAAASRSAFVAASKEAASLVATVKGGGVERALGALAAERARVERFGFTATELARQKASLLRVSERANTERDNRLSASRADEYVRNFLNGETLPGEAVEYDLHRRLLPLIMLDDVNKLATEWFPERGRMVLVQGPERSPMPSEAQLAAVITAASTKDLTPYVDTVSASTLLDSPPVPGRVVREATKEGVGITEWELSNGIKVVLKPTTFQQDEIVMRATKPGGTSLASDRDYVPASTAVAAVTAGGVGHLNAIDLKKILTGKAASANPFIYELEQGISGTSARKDLETMLQLAYLRFTQPRRDDAAYGVYVDGMRSLLAAQSANPATAFDEAVAAARFQNHLRRRSLSASSVDEMNLDRSFAFYKERFADASGFTFVFVGSFDLPTMKPLVERYLGGLPSIGRHETWKDTGVRNATGVIEKRVERGLQPQGRTQLVFTGPFEYDQAHRIAIRAMADILQTRLTRVIREELGGTYAVTATASYAKIPVPEYAVTVSFGSDPQRTAELTTRIFKEIERLKAGGLTDAEMTDERKALIREYETNLQQNSYLTTQVLFRYQAGEDPAGFWNLAALYGMLDAATVQQAAKTYLNPANVVRVSLFPEKK